MRAIVLERFDGPDSRVREIPEPEPSAGHVFIQVKAFGIHRAEMHLRRREWAEAAPRQRHRGQVTPELRFNPVSANGMTRPRSAADRACLGSANRQRGAHASSGRVRGPGPW
jgi:hypothetical protein